MTADSEAASGGARDRWPASQPGGVAARASRSAASTGRGAMMRDLDHASVLVGELLAGVLVWGGLGWFVGTTWGGHPWLFIVGSLLGFAGGFYLLWLRAEGRVGRWPRARSSASRRRGEDDTPASADGDAEGS